MSSIVKNITFDCADPHALARFWGQATGWTVDEEPAPGYQECAVLPPDQTRPKLYFARVPEGRVVKNRIHLDLEPDDRTQNEEIARLTALGATMVHDERPGFGWVTMADPEGNEFCVELSAAEIAVLEAAEAGQAS